MPEQNIFILSSRQEWFLRLVLIFFIYQEINEELNEKDLEDQTYKKIKQIIENSSKQIASQDKNNNLNNIDNSANLILLIKNLLKENCIYQYSYLNKYLNEIIQKNSKMRNFLLESFDSSLTNTSQKLFEYIKSNKEVSDDIKIYITKLIDHIRVSLISSTIYADDKKVSRINNAIAKLNKETEELNKTIEQSKQDIDKITPIFQLSIFGIFITIILSATSIFKGLEVSFYTLFHGNKLFDSLIILTIYSIIAVIMIYIMQKIFFAGSNHQGLNNKFFIYIIIFLVILFSTILWLHKVNCI